MKSNQSLVKRLYPLKEAAIFLGRSEWSVRELIWHKRLPVVRKEGSKEKIYIDIADLNKFVEQNKHVYE